LDPFGNLIGAYYQGLDRLASITRPDGGSSKFTYVDTPGSVSEASKVTQTPGADIVTTTAYDGLGRKASTDVAETVFTTFAYDGQGRAAYASLPSASLQTAECINSYGTVQITACTPTYGTLTRFDASGRPTAAIQPGGASTSMQYMADETLITDPTNAGKLQTADRDGNLVAVLEDPGAWYGGPIGGTHLGYPTSYVYDPLNDLTAVSQSSSRGRSFIYDSFKRLVQAQNPESGTIKYS
jgi:YD repeat-containing protein